MLAEVKYPGVVFYITSGELWQQTEVGGFPGSCRFHEPLESDSAAACSLLPKLAEALTGDTKEDFCADVAVALRIGTDWKGRIICEIIADAVRGLKEKSDA